MFTPIPGEMIQFDEVFSDGLVQPPTSLLILNVIQDSKFPVRADHKGAGVDLRSPQGGPKNQLQGVL